jgi:hypothetical protein
MAHGSIRDGQHAQQTAGLEAGQRHEIHTSLSLPGSNGRCLPIHLNLFRRNGYFKRKRLLFEGFP